MRILVATALLGAFICTANRQAIGQSADKQPSWSRVQSLPLGQDLRVDAKPHNANCKFVAATEATLTCAKDGGYLTFQRADIKFVKLSRRGASAAEGAIPGVVVMATGGVALAADHCAGQFLCGLGPSLLIALGVVIAVIGTVVGALTDFGGQTIYRRP